jgi:hypothetical protein
VMRCAALEQHRPHPDGLAAHRLDLAHRTLALRWRLSAADLRRSRNTGSHHHPRHRTPPTRPPGQRRGPARSSPHSCARLVVIALVGHPACPTFGHLVEESNRAERCRLGSPQLLSRSHHHDGVQSVVGGARHRIRCLWRTPPWSRGVPGDQMGRPVIEPLSADDDHRDLLRY